VSDELARLLEQVKHLPPMTPEQIEAQRQSFIRAFAPCEHGDRDWETCPGCLANIGKDIPNG
jgi:hypothetical protein